MRERLVLLGRIGSSAGLGFSWVLFAAASLHIFHVSGRPAGLGAVVAEFVAVVLFVTRRQPEWASFAKGDWLVAAIGGFGVMAARPVAGHLAGADWLYQSLQLIGAALALMCLLSIGRSFGIVPANRGVQTRGAYGIVRHPIYASYMVIDAGYLLENLTLRNAVVLAVVFVCQLGRMHREEACLRKDPGYAEYMRHVRYRVLPYVY
jgi:protein-S-isoprenylcysteine O-methyltransferase Ste14